MRASASFSLLGTKFEQRFPGVLALAGAHVGLERLEFLPPLPRTKTRCRARELAAWLATHSAEIAPSTVELAALMGYANHTTVRTALLRVQYARERDPAFAVESYRLLERAREMRSVAPRDMADTAARA